MAGASTQASSQGSYSSAELVIPPPLVLPPVTRTSPLVSSNAECPLRSVDIGAADEIDPSALNIATEELGLPFTSPPVIITRPSGSSTAAAPVRPCESTLELTRSEERRVGK